MTETFAERVIEFNRDLDYRGSLPPGYRVMNPFLENPETMSVMEQFYRKYYGDRLQRRLILGINPSRNGSGVTGVPFTDTKHLERVCGIKMKSARTHEVSSVFMYAMINAYGGPEAFYRDFYINSPFPLAIIRETENGKWVNANYYDNPMLSLMTEEFMIDSLRRHSSLGLDTSEVYVLGIKNAAQIAKLNGKTGLFGQLIPLEHPRYIQQYKSREKQFYIDKYIRRLKNLKSAAN